MTSQVKIVGRYELLDPIGHGGMAVVYLARQTDLDRQVALKELRMFQSPDDPALAERFLREARMAGSMSHPNIVTVHEYFKHEGTPYIAMEYLQRGSLRPWVGSLTVAQIAGVLEGLLAALDHAERFHIVHRDLKPENLLVTDQGQVKVADFGIAKARTMNTNAFLTKDGTTVGTPTYMAPEQAMAQDLGPHTDLYSVGVMAYELLVGRVPFDDTDTPVAIIMRHVSEDIPPAHTVNPAVDRALSDWIGRLLVREPDRRTQTAEQAWDELEEIVLRLLGSRWRREARLVGSSEQPVATPLTPAPFTSTAPETPVPDAPPTAMPPGESRAGDFESFIWRGKPDMPGEPPGPAVSAPGPVESAPSPVEPAPSPDFVTFGKSAPTPTPREQAPPPATPAPAPSPPSSRPAWATASDPVQPAVEAQTVMPDKVPERPQPTERSGPSPDVFRRRRIALAAAGGGVAAIAVVVAVVVAGGGSGGGTGEKSQGLVLQGDAFALNVPTSWRKRAAADLPGSYARDAVAAAGPGGAYVVAEHRAGRADPTLLPPKLRSASHGQEPAKVTLAETQAYRYDGLHARGVEGRLRVYAVLTSEGVATVVCGSSAPAGPSASACDGIAQTLRLTSAEARPARLSDDYSALLAKTVGTLNTGVDEVNTSVADAGTAAANAAAMRRAARLYRDASAVLGKAGGDLNPVEVGVNARLATVFKRFASTLARVGRAAARSDAAALRSARGRVGTTRSRLAAITGELRRLGYSAAPPATPRTPSRLAPKARVAPLAPSSEPPTPVQPAPKSSPAPAPKPKPPPAPRTPEEETGTIG
jgi:serine/threonine protein kinase